MTTTATYLAALEVEAKDLAIAYNEANQTGKYDERRKIETAMDDKIGEYNRVCRDACYDECRNSPNPMLTACTIMKFKGICRRDKTEGDEKVPIRFIDEKDILIDLSKLHAHCKKKGMKSGIGASAAWMDVVQRMNFLLTARALIEGKVSPERFQAFNDSYAMSEIARQRAEFRDNINTQHRTKDPVSKSSLMEALQTSVDAMLGDGYKVAKAQLTWLLDIYCFEDKSKALGRKAPSHAKFREYMMKVCNAAINNITVSPVAYKAVKGAPEEVPYRDISKDPVPTAANTAAKADDNGGDKPKKTRKAKAKKAAESIVEAPAEAVAEALSVEPVAETA